MRGEHTRIQRVDHVETVLEWVEEHVRPGKDFPQPTSVVTCCGNIAGCPLQDADATQVIALYCSADTLIAHARALHENPARILKLVGYVDDTQCMDKLSEKGQELVSLFRARPSGPATTASPSYFPVQKSFSNFGDCRALYETIESTERIISRKRARELVGQMTLSESANHLTLFPSETNES